MEMNKTPLESLCAALAYAMGVEPPKYAEAANEDLTAYIDRCLAGQKADRVFIYNTDAIGQWLVENCDLTDYRDQEEYAAIWQEKVKQYDDMKRRQYEELEEYGELRSFGANAME